MQARRLLLWCFVAVHAAPVSAQVDRAVANDLVGVYAADEVGAQMAAYCAERAPGSAAAVGAARAAWRARFEVDAVRRRVEALVPDIAQRQRGLRDQVAARMAKDGAREAVCSGLARSWAGSAEMDLRRRYPRAYEAAPGTAAQTQAGPGPALDTARPSGVWISPAQLTAMSAKASGGRTSQERLQRAGLAGRIYIRGEVVRRGDSHFIEHVDGAFRSRIPVSAGINLAPYLGRTIVVSGVLERLPGSVAFLRETRIVADPSGLVASAEPLEPGLFRVAVDAEQVRAAPGRGIAAERVQAAFLVVEQGAQYRERAWLLLRDGSMYDRSGTPPEDLDAGASRRLEPQHWHRWKAAGADRIEWQRFDDHGRSDGVWRSARGLMAAPWATDARLDGVFQTSSFHGSLALGGTRVSRTMRFTPDGRFEASRSSAGGSGSMAADAGFSANASSHSDARGTRSSAGGGNADVSVSTRSQHDDGAEHRGSYRLDGYALELRYDSRRVERVLSFPVPWKPMAIFIGDSVYTRPDRR